MCTAVHTYLFVDGLDLISRSDSGSAGMDPERLLRPGGPLYPRDAARSVRLASRERSDPDSAGLHIRVRLRGETVVWSELMYPGLDHGVVEEVRFHLGQYLGEIERAYRQCVPATARVRGLTGNRLLARPSRHLSRSSSGSAGGRAPSAR